MGIRARAFLILALVLAGLVGAVLRSFYYQEPRRLAPAQPHDAAAIQVPLYEPQVYKDQPAARAGVLLVDIAHANNFTPGEISVLLSRVAARGFQIQYWEAPRGAEKEDLPLLLERALRGAHAFAVITPLLTFSDAEVRVVAEFVRRGGRLLLVGDPTKRFQGLAALERRDPLTTLAAAFGIVFESDYVYNLSDNAGHFRNVILTDFQKHPLTEGLRQVAFYTGGSLRVADDGLIRTSATTLSSERETLGGLIVAALSHDGGVLALGDLTFMSEPYNTTFDNDRFGANIADFLTTGQRRYTLADFPHFLRSPAYVVYEGDALLPLALRVSTLLSRQGKEAQVVALTSFVVLRDAIFLGLYQDAGKIEPLLAPLGAKITDTLTIAAFGEVEKKGTTFLAYDDRSGARRLLLLADKQDTLKKTIEALESGTFRRFLVSDSLALHRLEETPSRIGDLDLVPSRTTPRTTPTLTPTPARTR